MGLTIDVWTVASCNSFLWSEFSKHKEKKRGTQHPNPGKAVTPWFLPSPWFPSKVKTIIRTYICMQPTASHLLPHPLKTIPVDGRTDIFLIPIVQMRRVGLPITAQKKVRQDVNSSFDIKPWNKDILSPGCSPLWHPQTSAPWCRHSWVTMVAGPLLSILERDVPCSLGEVGKPALWSLRLRRSYWPVTTKERPVPGPWSGGSTHPHWYSPSIFSGPTHTVPEGGGQALAEDFE